MSPKSPNSEATELFACHPFLLPAEDVARQLGTNIETGLTTGKVAELQKKYPPNELQAVSGAVWHKILLRQICNAMVLVLVFAMILSYAFRDDIEGAVLAVVIVLNCVIGFFQEFKAEKEMAALRQLSSPSASVLRDGRVHVIPSAEVVLGDIVSLRMGDTVPADLRIFEAMNLHCDEKSLTGEAEPVEKKIENNIVIPSSQGKLATSERDMGIADRYNMAYATTTVTKGRGQGIVTFTGMDTEVGKIAIATTKKVRKPGRSMNVKKYGKTQLVKGLFWRSFDSVAKVLGLTEGTPLQRKLSLVAIFLLLVAILLASIVFAVNRSMSNEVVIYAIAIAIAVIPESLVAVLTITMVGGMRAMRRQNVIVRDLSALEALGGVTNICSDKTGTLTQGAMVAKKVWLPGAGIYTVENSMNPNDPTQGLVTKALEHQETTRTEISDYDSERRTAALRFGIPTENAETESGKKETFADDVEAEMTPELEAFLRPTALCNLATVTKEQVEGQNSYGWQSTGEPTEIALQVLAHRFNYDKKHLTTLGWNQIAEYPFDSNIKRMTVVYNGPDSEHSVIFTKGAVERIIDLCSSIGSGQFERKMTNELKEKVLSQMDEFASQGQRVLAVASRTWSGDFASQIDNNRNGNDDELRAAVEQNLNLVGLVGIYDPPRVETKDAIRQCSEAGIKVHMLTGDHPATATAIAKEIGIIPRSFGNLSAEVSVSIVMKATDFDAMSEQEIDNMAELPIVIARCAPNTKTRMIYALQRRRCFIAMTGDGVNDAPSLTTADVGIAMGSGSDVAKNAAKIVLTDDKFNSIVAAISEGRRLFDNIQKFNLHLLTSNVGEVVLLIAGLGFRDDSHLSVFVLSPLQVLWINMLTSSFPAFGLGREKPCSEIMRRPPRSMKYSTFTPQIMADMLVYGFLMGSCSLFTFVIIVYGYNEGNLGHDCNRHYNESCDGVFRARAAVFAELTWLILISAWEFTSIRNSMFNPDPGASKGKLQFIKDLYHNRVLFWSVVGGGLVIFPAIYIPGFNTKVFKQKGITWEWILVFLGVAIFISGIEIWKFIKRRYNLLETGDRRTDDEEKQSRLLGLRQGFFTLSRATTAKSSLARRSTGV